MTLTHCQGCVYLCSKDVVVGIKPINSKSSKRPMLSQGKKFTQYAAIDFFCLDMTKDIFGRLSDDLETFDKNVTDYMVNHARC